MASLRFIDFFAGIGAGGKGFEEAGHKCVAVMENDRTCQAILLHHSPSVPLFQDVRWTLPALLPVADLYTISDPCQANTCANSRANNGRLAPSFWRDAFRYIRSRTPDFVIRENPTHQRRNAPSRHEYVASDLEKVGYVCTIIDMQGGEISGVSRQRTFVCAGLGSAGERLRECLARHRCDKRNWPKIGSPAIPFAALTCHPYRYDNRDNFILYRDGRVRVLSRKERLLAQGLPETWLDCLGEVSLMKCAKLTGNAWPVFMARFIGRCLYEATEGDI